MTELKVHCRHLGGDLLYLYERTSDILGKLKSVEVPADDMFIKLENAISLFHVAPGHHRAFLSDEEYRELDSRMAYLRRKVKGISFDGMAADEKWSRIKPALDDAARLVRQVEDILLTKLVDCQCKE